VLLGSIIPPGQKKRKKGEKEKEKSKRKHNGLSARINTKAYYAICKLKYV
jgi:hypothetical protein